jgi:hypothetical protein
MVPTFRLSSSTSFSSSPAISGAPASSHISRKQLVASSSDDELAPSSTTALRLNAALGSHLKRHEPQFDKRRPHSSTFPPQPRYLDSLALLPPSPSHVEMLVPLQTSRVKAILLLCCNKYPQLGIDQTDEDLKELNRTTTDTKV